MDVFSRFYGSCVKRVIAFAREAAARNRPRERTTKHDDTPADAHARYDGLKQYGEFAVQQRELRENLRAPSPVREVTQAVRPA